nr:winged helix-turn-helix domain-containing protein [Rhodococcus fascians]
MATTHLPGPPTGAHREQSPDPDAGVGIRELRSQLVEVHISSLRKKLELHGPRVIDTVRGIGYVLLS